jgi:hypothetical protein
MKKIEISQLIGIFANVGVIAGLVILAYEIRQNTSQIRAEASYSINQSVELLNQAVFQDEAFADLLIRGEQSFQNLTPTEQRRLTAYFFAEINLADYIIGLKEAGLADLHFDYVEFKIGQFNSVAGRKEFVDSVLTETGPDNFGSQELYQRLVGE